jgi:hypothetical protein
MKQENRYHKAATWQVRWHRRGEIEALQSKRREPYRRSMDTNRHVTNITKSDLVGDRTATNARLITVLRRISVCQETPLM